MATIHVGFNVHAADFSTKSNVHVRTKSVCRWFTKFRVHVRTQLFILIIFLNREGKFTPEEDEKLIDFVEAKSILFIVSDQTYKNSLST